MRLETSEEKGEEVNLWEALTKDLVPIGVDPKDIQTTFMLIPGTFGSDGRIDPIVFYGDVIFRLAVTRVLLSEMDLGPSEEWTTEEQGILYKMQDLIEEAGKWARKVLAMVNEEMVSNEDGGEDDE